MTERKRDILSFQEGQTYIADIGSMYKYKIHIVAVIDEGLSHCPMIVYRFYGKTKQWWHYEIKSAFLLTGDIKRAETFIDR